MVTAVPDEGFTPLTASEPVKLGPLEKVAAHGLNHRASSGCWAAQWRSAQTPASSPVLRGPLAVESEGCRVSKRTASWISIKAGDSSRPESVKIFTTVNSKVLLKSPALPP